MNEKKLSFDYYITLRSIALLCLISVRKNAKTYVPAELSALNGPACAALAKKQKQLQHFLAASFPFPKILQQQKSYVHDFFDNGF